MQAILPMVKNPNRKIIQVVKRQYRLLVFFSAMLVAGIPLYAQDPHFSQFFVSPLTLNPAYTGKFDGAYRFSGNFKKQWPTVNNAFTTSTAAIDFNILTNRLPENDNWGVGLLAVNDQSGNKILNNSFYSISTAYAKSLDEDGLHQITIGFQGTLANKRLDVRRADFEDELTALGFTGSTLETFAGNPFAINYVDINTGFMYAFSTDGDNSFYLGTSIYHLNRPNESFNNGIDLLNSRTTLHGGAYLPLGQWKSFHASFMHQSQGGATETLAGGAFAVNMNYSTDQPATLYAGAWYRFGDALIPYLGMEVNQFRFGFTYDINNSSLNTASAARGGAELSIIYINGYRDPLRKKVHCPKF